MTEADWRCCMDRRELVPVELEPVGTGGSETTDDAFDDDGEVRGVAVSALTTGIDGEHEPAE